MIKVNLSLYLINKAPRHEAMRRSDITSSPYSTQALEWMSGQFHAPAALPPGNSSQYPLEEGWIGHSPLNVIE
jgi:hypothetical protein